MSIDIAPPIRRVAACTFLNRMGNGLLLVLVPVYFVRHLGFTLPELGLTFGVATLLAVAAPVPTGALIERADVRTVYRAALLALALCSLLPVLTTSVGPAAVGWLVLSAAEGVFGTSNQVLVAEYSAPGAAATSKGFLRAVSNVSMSVGMAAAGAVLVLDDERAFRLAFAANVLLTLAALVLSGRVPRVARPHRPTSATNVSRRRVWDAFRDTPYLLTTFAVGVMSVHFAAIEVALALFLIERTDLPKWSVSAFLIVNTVGVAVLQTHVASRSTTVSGTPRFLVGGATLILVALMGIGLCARLPLSWQLALLLLAALVYTVGEMAVSAGEWTLLFDSVPPGRQGAYQGLAGASQAGFDAAARTVAGVVCLAFGGLGWWLIGGIALVGAFLASSLTPSLERRRSAHLAASS